MMKQEHVEWCRKLFSNLADRGSWGIPRSGLVFQKQGDELVLTARMPHDPAMPVTAEQLVEQQNADFEGTRRHFAEAGVTVRSAV